MSVSSFPTTRWSIVDQLSGDDNERARVALEMLCQQYREPLVQFLLLAKISTEDEVEDVIQDFLAYFIARENFKRADPVRGRLRTFLIGSLKNFANNTKARASAIKRGGNTTTVSLDDTHPHPANGQSVEEIFDRSWGMTVMNRAVDRLKAEFQKRGKEQWFQHIARFLEWQSETDSYDEVAQALDVRPNRVALEVFRMRRRFREIIREEVGQTVGEQSEIEDELRYLARVLASESLEP